MIHKKGSVTLLLQLGSARACPHSRRGLWSAVTAMFYGNRSKKLRTDVEISEMDGFGSIFTFLKSVFPSWGSRDQGLYLEAFP